MNDFSKSILNIPDGHRSYEPHCSIKTFALQYTPFLKLGKQELQEELFERKFGWGQTALP
jgi:hypothetical protein